MAENITADFTQSAARAVAASNIAHDWANGGDTTEIPTESGPLPSLRKFMYENVSAAENTRLDLVFGVGETSKSLSSAVFFSNLFYRVSGHIDIVDIVLPSIAKVFYVENIGDSALRLVRGSTFETVAMDETVLGYTDGTANGLTLILPSEVINNYTATSTPTINDDITQGYSVGSRWIDNSETPVVSYVALDVTEGAAFWTQTGITIDDLGDMATQSSNSVTITGGNITGITDLAIADGGTGASTSINAFNNLKQLATTESSGVVEKATPTEVLAGEVDKYPDSAGVIAAITANASPIQDQAAWNGGELTVESNISPEKLDTKIRTLAMGENQTYQDVSASRALGVNYTNSTGKTIEVAVSLGVNIEGQLVTATVDGVVILSCPVGGFATAFSFMVPNGSVYSLSAPSGFQSWAELR